MTSAKKISANRANSLKSTGPKSGRGKSESRLNAIKHGAFARLPLLDGEDRHERAELEERLRAEYRPETSLELLLVEQLLAATWRLRRIERAESAYFQNIEQENVSEALKKLNYVQIQGLSANLDHLDDADKKFGNALEREDERRHDVALQNRRACVWKVELSSNFSELPFHQQSQLTSVAHNRIKQSQTLDQVLYGAMISEIGSSRYGQIDRLRRSNLRDILGIHETLRHLRDARKQIDSSASDVEP